MGKTSFFEALGSRDYLNDPATGTPLIVLSHPQIDAEKSVILGVSVITEGEAKGHGVLIDAQTLSEVKTSAEAFKGGVKVKINHGTGFDAIVGTLKDFRIDGSHLRADLHLLKSHALYDQILEIASTFPESFGLSISFSGVTEEKGDVQYARCDELYSVDLVDDPAANPSGLFSARDVDSRKDDMADEKSRLEEFKAWLGFSKELSEPKIAELSAKLTASDADLIAARKSVSELSAKVKEQADLVAASALKVTDLDAKIEKHTAELESKSTDKANAVLASLGVPPVAASISGDKKDFSALVVAEMAASKSTKSAALTACVSKFKTEYLAWKNSGKTQSL